jgi:hypothetical protein
MKADHEQPGGDDLQDLWSLAEEAEGDSVEELEAEEEVEALETIEDQTVTSVAPAPATLATEAILTPAELRPLAYVWIEEMIAHLPVTVHVVLADGQTLYEHERYLGLLVDFDAYRAGQYDLPHLDERWFVVQMMRYDTEHGPMPWGDDLPQHQPQQRKEPPLVEDRREASAGQPAKKWEGGVRLRYRAVPTAFVDVITGEGVSGDLAFQAGSYPTLLEITRTLPPEVERVYLVGPRPGREGTPESLYMWLRQPEIGIEWEVTKFEPDDDAPILSLRQREPAGEGKRRELRFSRAAQWFGPGRYSPRQAQEAMVGLEAILQKTFDDKMRCLTTPGLTGLAAWDRSRKADYPLLDEETQALIRSTSTQGRVEICPVPGRDPLPGFVYEDGRFMYASLTKGIGFGPATRDDIPEFDPRRRGRYHITFRVPDGWDHLGLFAVQSDSRREPWMYPWLPGEVGETWVGSTELDLALNPPRGLPAWSINILERLLFQNTSAGHPWPLDVWGDKLIDARLSIEPHVAAGEFSAEIGEMIEAGLRTILLHGIGGFHRRNRPELCIVYPHEGYGSIPASADPQFHHDGTATYKVTKPLDKWIARLMHPEFSAQIWDRCRRHLLYSAKKKMGQIVPGSESGVLLLERKEVVGLRTDAAYLTRNPGWPDDGRTPGQFRMKGQINEPVPQPDKSGAGHKLLNQLRDRSRANLLQAEALTTIFDDEADNER